MNIQNAMPGKAGSSRVLWVMSGALVCLGFGLVRDYPAGWDAAEYALCAREGFLPHSPYILHNLLSRFLTLFVSAPLALSLVSLASAVGVIWGFHALVCHVVGSGVDDKRVSKSVALWTTLFLVTTYAFLHESVNQEVYMLQMCLGLLSMNALLRTGRRARFRAGLWAGLAIVSHSGSVFFLPIWMFILWTRPGENRWRGMAHWLGSCLTTVGFFVLILWWLFPGAESGLNVDFLAYLRGIAPPIHWERLTEPAWLWTSFEGLVARLFSTDGASAALPMAFYPTGLFWAHGFFMTAGLVRLLVRKRFWLVMFWLLFPSAAILYELLLGTFVDYGTYAVFVLPMCVFLAAQGLMGAVDGFKRLWPKPPRALVPIFLTVAITGLALPTIHQIHQRMSGETEARQAHFSSQRLAALWMADNLPPNALVLQPRKARNVNLFPYYAQRRHLMRDGRQVFLFRGGVPNTPMNMHAFERLKPAALKAILASPIPVYSLDPVPWGPQSPYSVITKGIVWRPVHTLDASVLAGSEGARARGVEPSPGNPVTLYRAFIQ